MQTIDILLKRYAHIKAPDAALKKAFVKVIKTMFGIDIGTDAIRIHGGAARIQAPSVLKNEIRLNKEEILANVAKEVGGAKAVGEVF